MRARRVLKALAFFAAVGCEETTGPNLAGNVPGYSITEVDVTPSSATVLVPDTITTAHQVQFSATAFGRTGAPISGVRFVWSTSDPTIATVDSSGLVTPIMPGTVEVSASAYRVGKATLVILPATQSVQVSPTRDSIFVDEPIVSAGDTINLEASAFDPSGEQLAGVAFAWSSSAPAVATVEQDGTVHAIGLGNATITASSNGISAQSIVTVLPVVARVDLSTPALQVLAMDTLQLAAVARGYDDASMGRTFTWTSSNPSVATVDMNGQVIFVSAGSATITARTAFRTATVTITSFPRLLLTLDAGDDYTCGYTALGRGYCWGLSNDGRTAAAADSTCFPGPQPCILPPKRMNRPDLSFTAISAGDAFGCGLATDQMLYCWGSDESGQIGNGQDGAGATPSLATVKTHRFTTVSAGAAHACALNLVGTAYCWGNDGSGQLGDNTTVNSTTPIPVADTTLAFMAISAGNNHTCAVTTTGVAYCWGDNTFGQLGNGTQAMSLKPALVSGGLTFVAISAGDSYTCAIDTAANAHCWGENTDAQLGQGIAGGIQLVPTLVTGGGSYTAISAGGNHTCGIALGAVRCWGGSEFGEVGDGVEPSHIVVAPTTVVGLTASSISVGARHSCAITTAGAAMCWGSNLFGTLGNEYQAVVRAIPQVVARPR